jgi:membrane protein DedA with SNARE-associated domain
MPQAPGVVRAGLLAVLAVRGALGLLAVALAASLYEDHFVALVALRPTKDVLLAAGFLVREGDVGVLPVYLAAVPLAVIGVWAAYLLGRSFADDLDEGLDLPGIVGRLLPSGRINDLRAALDRKGSKVVFFGRLAVFPSVLMGAAAGASGMEPRAFVVADTAGLLVAITEVLAAGYVLGEAYDRAGAWLSAVGAVVAVALMVLLGRSLRARRATR